MITGYYSKDYLFDDLTSGIQRRLGILCFPKTLVWSRGILEVTEAKNFLMMKVRLLSFLSLVRGRKGALFVF